MFSQTLVLTKSVFWCLIVLESWWHKGSTMPSLLSPAMDMKKAWGQRISPPSVLWYHWLDDLQRTVCQSCSNSISSGISGRRKPRGNGRSRFIWKRPLRLRCSGRGRAHGRIGDWQTSEIKHYIVLISCFWSICYLLGECSCIAIIQCSVLYTIQNHQLFARI